MGQILELMPADVAGWTALVAGFATLALLLRLDRARKDRRVVVGPARPVGQLEPGSDWQRIMDVSLAEIARSPDLHAMQARAASQIDAAEHAFNRLLAECAEVRAPVVAPSFEPLRQLAREPAAVPDQQQQPLAA
jgi:hypothetical protein